MITPRPWDRRAAESDPAYEAFAAYLEAGSLRDAYRQRSGKAQATSAPGAWTGWSSRHNWVSRRAAHAAERWGLSAFRFVQRCGLGASCPRKPPATGNN